MPYRVVRSPGATVRPFRVVPRPRQTEPPGRGGIGGTTVRNELPFDQYGNPTDGGVSIDDLLAGTGMQPPRRPGGIDANGMPYSNFYNPVGGGTLPGALMNMSGGGRALQQQIGSHYGGGFGERSWGSLTGPGGLLAGRAFGTQLVGQEGGGGGSEPQSGSRRAPQFHGESPTDAQAEKTIRLA